ncbi:hypothetical protein N007_18885 [Alicyclobacillus acidoterrestris ATCC 49025]|nr:hypothetical protein N007_18885 [Alicyclobacillus acidoterrestris ATCC 49025]
MEEKFAMKRRRLSNILFEFRIFGLTIAYGSIRMTSSEGILGFYESAIRRLGGSAMCVELRNLRMGLPE